MTITKRRGAPPKCWTCQECSNRQRWSRGVCLSCGGSDLEFLPPAASQARAAARLMVDVVGQGQTVKNPDGHVVLRINP